MKHTRPKVTISGAGGRNGSHTILEAMHLPGVGSLVGLVRNDKEQLYLEGRISAEKERFRHLNFTEPHITQDPRDTLDSDIWVNWKGVNLAALSHIYAAEKGKNITPELEKKAELLDMSIGEILIQEEAQRTGKNSRDLLLERNIGITLEDAELAKRYGAPNLIYIQQGNPVHTLAQIVMEKLQFDSGKVITSGAHMEYRRFLKLFESGFKEELGKELQGLRMNRATGLYIGDHGEKAVPVEEQISFGGVNLASLVEYLDPLNGRKRLEKVYKKVNNEALWIRERMKETPSIGPAAVSAELIDAIVGKKGFILGIGTYVKDAYSAENTVITVPASLGYNGATVIPTLKLSKKTQEKFTDAYKHIRAMNAMAKKMV